MRTLWLTTLLAAAIFGAASLTALTIRIAIVTAAPGGVATERDSIGVMVFTIITALFTAITIRLLEDTK